MAAGASVIVLTTAAAAFAIAQYQPVTNKAQARCYTVADIDAYYLTIAVAGRSGTRAEVGSALNDCAALYGQGFLRVGVAGVHPPTGPGTREVPGLVACTMRDHSAAVFPGGPGTCAQLDLPAAMRKR